jgi:glycosyltransferase involved in cell wall biosynthesis
VTGDFSGRADGRRLRVLFVTPYVPSRLRPRPLHFIRYLAEQGHRTTLVCLARSSADLGAAEELRSFTEQLHVVPVSALRSVWNCARAIPSAVPFQAAFVFSPVARRLVARLLGDGSAGRFDLVHVEHLRGAPLASGVTGVPVVFDAVDCISRLLSEAKRLAPTGLGRLAARIDLRRTQRFESRLSAYYARVLTTSEADRRALVELAERGGESSGGRIAVLANGVDSAHFRPATSARDPSTLVYVGRMSYHGNVRAVEWLIERIMPLVWARRRDARLEIVGDAPSPLIRRLAARHEPRVVVTGYVPDVRPHLQRAAISVNSLVYGVGVQNKVLEAMATATPVVTTAVGCNALQARDGEDLLVASEPASFAASVLRLLEEPALRERIGTAGRAYVERHHAWPLVGRGLERVYGEVLRDVPGGLRGGAIER